MSYGRSLARPPSVVTTDTACIDNHIASWTLIYWRCQFNTCMRSVFNNEAIFSKLSCINFQGRVPHCTWRPSAMCNEVYKMYWVCVEELHPVKLAHCEFESFAAPSS